MAKYNSPEEVDNDRRYYRMAKKHMCWGCPWAKVLQDRFVCPFVAGSCARIPRTLTKPDPELVSARLWPSLHSADTAETYDAGEEAAHGDD